MRHPGRWEPGDEVWYDDAGERVYRQPDDVPVTTWVTFVGDAPQAVSEAPGRPQPAPVDIAATPDPSPIPVTRAQRVRNLVAAVRKGDRSAVDALREAMGSDDAA